MSNICEIRNNNLFLNGIPIKTLGVIIDAVSDSLIKLGEYEDIKSYAEYTITAYSKINANTDIRLFKLANLSLEEQCYVANRMFNYTQTNFIRNFANNCNSNNGIEWLHNEMQRVKIA